MYSNNSNFCDKYCEAGYIWNNGCVPDNVENNSNNSSDNAGNSNSNSSNEKDI